MNKAFFSKEVGGHFIHGLVELPGGGKGIAKKAVIFLPGMGGYRVGPHDIFSYLSEKFVQVGYCCIRFDYRGKGFSGYGQFPHSATSMLEDIQTVISYVKKELKIDWISFCGICLGAKLALYYAKNIASVDHLFLLSSVPLRTEIIPRRIAHKQVQIYALEYLNKIFRYTTWMKLLTGKIHVRMILNRIFNPYKSQYKLQQSYVSAKTNFLCNLKFAVLIHAEMDPDTMIALPQIERLLQENKVLYHSAVIKNANHSFYSVKWTNQIWQIINKHLNITQ